MKKELTLMREQAHKSGILPIELFKFIGKEFANVRINMSGGSYQLKDTVNIFFKENKQYKLPNLKGEDALRLEELLVKLEIVHGELSGHIIGMKSSTYVSSYISYSRDILDNIISIESKDAPKIEVDGKLRDDLNALPICIWLLDYLELVDQIIENDLPTENIVVTKTANIFDSTTKHLRAIAHFIRGDLAFYKKTFGDRIRLNPEEFENSYKDKEKDESTKRLIDQSKRLFGESRRRAKEEGKEWEVSLPGKEMYVLRQMSYHIFKEYLFALRERVKTLDPNYTPGASWTEVEKPFRSYDEFLDKAPEIDVELIDDAKEYVKKKELIKNMLKEGRESARKKVEEEISVIIQGMQKYTKQELNDANIEGYENSSWLDYFRSFVVQTVPYIKSRYYEIRDARVIYEEKNAPVEPQYQTSWVERVGYKIDKLPSR